MFLTECPRDAMQGWGEKIPTATKVDYINALLKVNFNVLDCGSFVSPKAIPQMADTGLVMEEIDKTNSNTKISVIVANLSGAEKALSQKNVDVLGFPFSISQTFQYRNTNKNQEEAFLQIQEILEMTAQENKELNVYFSMAFGNPYGELWKWEEVDFWANRFSEMGIKSIMLSDTTGVATTEKIAKLFSEIPKKYPNVFFGAHFHNLYQDAHKKLKVAYDNGCRRFDSAIKGLGGCPMAKDDLVGNMPTEQVFTFMEQENLPIAQNLDHFKTAYKKAQEIFHF